MASSRLLPPTFATPLLTVRPRPIATFSRPRHVPRTPRDRQIGPIVASDDPFGFTKRVLVNTSGAVFSDPGRRCAPKRRSMDAFVQRASMRGSRVAQSRLAAPDPLGGKS